MRYFYITSYIFKFASEIKYVKPEIINENYAYIRA